MRTPPWLTVLLWAGLGLVIFLSWVFGWEWWR